MGILRATVFRTMLCVTGLIAVLIWFAAQMEVHEFKTNLRLASVEASDTNRDPVADPFNPDMVVMHAKYRNESGQYVEVVQSLPKAMADRLREGQTVPARYWANHPDKIITTDLQPPAGDAWALVLGILLLTTFGVSLRLPKS